MANIGATTAFYKVETSLTRANNEVSKSMERLATGKQNANAGDRSSYVAMADTFRLDYVGTKAGIKGASVVMGYLETGMRVLDAASSLLARLQELAVLGANNTNTTQDHEAINLEAEALAEEFNRLMTTSSYKGKDVFVTNAGSEYVGLGGRGAEMTFGIGRVGYTEIFGSSPRTIVSGPNAGDATFNIAHLPSDAAVAKAYGAAVSQRNADSGNTTLAIGKQYVVRDVVTTGVAAADTEIALATSATETSSSAVGAAIGTAANKISVVAHTTTTSAGSTKSTSDSLAHGDHITVGTAAVTVTAVNSGGNQKSVNFAEVRTDQDAFVKGETYVIHNVGTAGVATGTVGSDAYFIAAAATNADATSTAISGDLRNGQKITIKANATDGQMAALNSLIEGITFTKASDTLTSDIETIQARINTARVQAGSQYAALESAVAYTTDLTAQYELGYNTVNDVNFSMETAHLAKNQILQQAATAMLAQANQGQQSLLQLIQG